MLIQVNKRIEKSLTPPKLNIKGQNGFVIQKLEDGYWLIEFNNIFDRKGRLLQWYVHKSDLTIIT